MKINKSLNLFVLLVTFALHSEAQDWKLIWSDEFNTDGPLNSAVWNFEQGYARNEEEQWYQPDNAICKDGMLVIEARKEQNRRNPNYEAGSKEWRKNREFVGYTSSSVNTSGKKEFLYGRFEIRARIPVAKGAWPAIWTLGSGMDWPSCGEIDIMEYYQIKGVPHILANAAWGTDKQWHAKWNSRAIPYTHFIEKDAAWASKFHIWRMDWDETAIKLYLDDELLNEIPLSSTINGNLGKGENPFKKPQYMLLNLAVGGINGGQIDEAALPIKYEIDYVRVYQKKQEVVPGAVWKDNNGKHINAHGGGILFHEGKYYWFGEHRPTSGFVTEVGVTCYSSTDLCNWNYEGVALAVSGEAGSDIEKGCIMERPKVIYNSKTGKFVMWFHLELKGKGYEAARTALAVSDTPVGPYKFVRSGRVNPGIYPQNMTEKERDSKLDPQKYKKWWTPEWHKAIEKGMFVKRDLRGGQMSRDMTLFVDEDGKAYHIYSSEDNLTLQIAELTDDYQGHTGKYIRLFPGGHNEAPAIFKKDGVYWMITSGCTGWEPNKARLMSASSMWGPWTQYPNPCIGEGADKTFGGQSTYILTLPGAEDKFIFMADRWKPENLMDSRHIWLPIRFDKDGKPYIQWEDRWNPWKEEQKEQADMAADRELWCDVMYRMAAPVLSNMSKGKLQQNMLVELSPTWDGRNKGVTYMECFGRLMAGLAPWLSLPDDNTTEGAKRKQLREWALKSYAQAVDPQGTDYLLWRKEGQTLVDAAYVAESFLRGYEALWLPLDSVTKQRYITEFTQLRRVDPPYTNWLLFSSTVESFLRKAGAQSDTYRIASALRKVEEWYVGDGWYSDGPGFAFDYYNSFVLHPMYVECLEVMTGAGKNKIWNMPDCNYNRAIKRMQRFGMILERFISPEGTFPVFGRSITYRTGILQPLALLAWRGQLPEELKNGQVRAAMTAVIKRMFSDNHNFNEKGFLTLGFNGSQPHISDWYTNNGSLYMASLAFLPLGLPADHPFWTDVAQSWTSKKAWEGADFPKDHALYQ